MARYIKITHNDREIGTVGDFFNRPVNLVTGIGVKEFLDYAGDPEDENPVSNINRIIRKHILKADKKRNQDFYDNGEYESIELKVGTSLLVPRENIQRETLFALDDNVINTTSSKAFLAGELERLLRDPNYTQAYDLGQLGETKEHNTTVTVWMWVRSLSPNDGSAPTGSWIDVSPFVQSVTTDVTKDAGQFVLQLAPVIGKKDEEKGWIIDPKTIENYSEGRRDQNFIANSPLRRKTKRSADGSRESRFFFHQAVQENDLVYIRFEDLEREKEDGNIERQKPFGASSVAGNIYDMIGLVDKSFLKQEYQGSDAGIAIQGRDLMKILIEDGSYFFPLQFAQNVFAQNGSRRIAERSLVDGRLLTLSAYLERNILFSLQFIISQLSATGLVPDSVFLDQGYSASELSKTFIIPGGADVAIDKLRALGKKKPDIGELPSSGDQSVVQPGVWQIIKLLVDPGVSDRRIVDASISQEQGSMINSVKKLCQDPFVEFYGDTYGDKYVFQARKPPFDYLGYTGMVYDNITSTDANNLNSSREAIFNQQITQLEDVNLSGVSVPVGGDSDRLSDLTLDVQDVDVISKDLYYDTEAYSWYYIKPSALLFGNSQKLALAYVPAISFDEYANQFGSRVFSKEHNYLPYRPIEDNKLEERDNYLLKQTVEDLKYMIESTQYLPFTRRGTILINGNRTFKRGMFLRLRSTNEIFHIDAVQHSWSIAADDEVDRTTLLTVSRGMVEPFIRGVETVIGFDRVNVSYFNIVNLEIPQGAVTDTEFLKNWTVNQEIFSFFQKRNQWKL